MQERVNAGGARHVDQIGIDQQTVPIDDPDQGHHLMIERLQLHHDAHHRPWRNLGGRIGDKACATILVYQRHLQRAAQAGAERGQVSGVGLHGVDVQDRIDVIGHRARDHGGDLLGGSRHSLADG